MARPGNEASFNYPQGITVDGEGNALVADTDNRTLRKATRRGVVSTLAGNGEEGYADGIDAAAPFNNPWGIVMDAQGAIFVADSKNHCLQELAPSTRAVSTLAGDAEEEIGFADGQGAAVRFYNQSGMALDTDGHLIVANASNNCIRKVTTA